MNYKTHKIGGVSAGVLLSATMFCNEIQPLSFIASGLMIYSASLGSVAPDIDKTTTKVGRKFFLRPISHYLQNRYGHRTITHALVASIIVFAILLFLAKYMTGFLQFVYFYSMLGFGVGYISHLVLDMLTIRGIPVFYPISHKRYMICKFKTSKHEDLITSLLVVATGISLYFIFNL